jgi:hypothetical protein
MTTYTRWRDVPANLYLKSALAALDFPRTCDGVEPVASIETRNWRGKWDAFDLYDVASCSPTRSGTAALRARVGTRKCPDCGARCQQPLVQVDETSDRMLCPACRHIALLRRDQAVLADERAQASADVAKLLAGPAAVVLQLDDHEPPVAESGRRRAATALRIQVAGLDGKRLLDVTARLVGPRAKWVPDGAIDQDAAIARLRPVLAGQRLIVWSELEIELLRRFDPDGGHPGPQWRHAWDDDAPVVSLAVLMRHWRGQLDPLTRELVPCVPPGSPERTALLLAQVASAATEPS